jgi:uncharacterized protein YacL
MKLLISLVGMTIGIGVGNFVFFLFPRAEEFFGGAVALLFVYYGVFALLFGIIFFISSNRMIDYFQGKMESIEQDMRKIPLENIILSAIGLIIGLIIAYLISHLVMQIPQVGAYISIVVYVFFAYLGIMVPLQRKDDILTLQQNFQRSSKDSGRSSRSKKKKRGSIPKVLDTSVIIDGRIADICETGFIEGPLVVPEFVLGEVQHIADSSDDLKRKKGRRGLDILNRIQKELDIEVEISSQDFPKIAEVDSKLLKLAQELNGKVVTNDYNLNKLAQFQGVEVLNVNELANAVKPIVLPGETMTALIIKEGKEANQGVAYLDDGTMIVVENGRQWVGQTITVSVTSVLQTAAGRMIFAKRNHR